MFNYLNTLCILYSKELKNRFSRRKRAHYPKFLITGLARTGTTLLHTYLNSHPQIQSSGEHDMERVRKELTCVGNQEKIIFPPYASHIRIGGAKILLPHEQNQSKLIILDEILQAEPSLKIIFLTRENTLRWLLSLQIAQKSNQWSQTNFQKKSALRHKQINLPVHLLPSRLEEISQLTEVYRQRFNRENTLEINYEPFSLNPQPFLRNIQDFLGVRPATLHTLLQKQNPEPLAELIKNYDAVEKVLQNTPYQKFLEDKPV